MNILKQIKQFLALLFIVVLMFSCSEDKKINTEAQIEQTENFVSLDDASGIASVMEFPIIPNSKNANLRAKGLTSTSKKIEKMLEVPDENGNPLFYIVNYVDAGFIIISADNRTNPIRAFSLTDKFPMEGELPNGLLEWLVETSDMVSEIRTLNQEQTEAVASTWEPCEIQAIFQIDDDDCGRGSCQNTSYTVGPLLSTTWGQMRGYNDLVENINCSTGTATTGCVATAMAQVMKFHESPSTYNWSGMPNTSGTVETARLMRDLGSAVGMTYRCRSDGGSGSYMNRVAGGFSTFGYQNVRYSGFNSNTVKRELDANRPVILSGNTNIHEKKKCFLFWCCTTYSYSGGHAWVCDGYRTSTTYSEDCSASWRYLYLHMNWGWNGSNNSWYAHNNWNPGNDSFNHNKEMIYNIGN